ncbi:NmrA family transcriptional regulator [Wenjunlia vitaminophila]|uniref:NmrA family transcriptional regulator n=1 Tax=Wenjunlia vitaminophila TaxID=76728 RepID=A0A0T6LQB0_WENVI|nr:NAD(P)H-binding protein [Wenjunlia vitaminophila]KRV48121.1 NmrA family transcriptional regulator [Wenjunlia vitaminophila]
MQENTHVGATDRPDHGAAGADRPRTVLVTGGTGKTGRRVARRLTDRGVRVRLASRSGAPRFDWTDHTTWGPALHGVDAAYLAYYPDVAAPTAADTLGAFAEQAVRSGVRRLVLLSIRGEAQAVPAEQAVRESGAEWAILRGSWFWQNFSEGFLTPGIHAGEVVFPAADVLEPFLDADDLADVAVSALTRSAPLADTYDLTGPRLLTFGGAVAEVARASGRQVRYVPVPPSEYPAHLTALGLPAEEAAFLTDVFTTLLDGRNAHLTDDVRRVLGRPPADFAAFARRAASEGAW